MIQLLFRTLASLETKRADAMHALSWFVLIYALGIPIDPAQASKNAA